MPYVTSVERIALQKGRAEGEAKGKAEALIQILKCRWSTKLPPGLEERIQATTELALLERWITLAFEADSPEKFRRLAQLRKR